MTEVAFYDFQESMQAVDGLATLESSYSDPPPSDQKAVCFGLRGAVTVLAVACFEGFLRSTFEEQLDRIAMSGTPLTQFPELRVSAIFSSLQHAMRGEYGTRGEDRKARVNSVLSAASLVGSDSFVPRALADTQSNPHSDCVKQMFKDIGKRKVFHSLHSRFVAIWGAPTPGTFCEDRLDSIVHSRHLVAHTANSAHVTRLEMNENIRFINVLAMAIQSELVDYIDGLLAKPD